MRFLMIAVIVSVSGFCTGAFAQPELPSVQAEEAQPAPPTQSDIVRQHPSWFSEAAVPYRPCPCSVVFPNGRHACLGRP